MRIILKKAVQIGKNKLKYRFYASKHPVFDGVERWYLSAEEFDFYPRELPENSRYLGSVIDFTRKEDKHPRVSVFLKKVELDREQNPKVIYCGFGTVIRSYLSDDELIAFYLKLNELARRHTNWHFLISISAELIDKITPTGFNIMFVKHVPQLEVLPHCDLFITHGGGSVMESIHAGVPMLCLPASDKADYRGNGARIQYHGLGIVSTIGAPIEQIEQNITDLLNNPSYRDNTRQFADILNKRYGDGYLESMKLPDT